MSTDIIDAIDGVISDWTTSADAMRWRPEGTPAHARQPTLADYQPAFDRIVQAFEEVAAIAAERMAALGAVFREAYPQLAALADALDPEELATGGAASPRVPTYRDQRPRWQSPYGPARRR